MYLFQPSLWAGVRAIEALVGTVREMGLVATFTDMQSPKVQDLFDDRDVLQNEAYREYVRGARSAYGF